jgi:hypothetical protein
MEQLLPDAPALPVPEAAPAGDPGATAHLQGEVFPGDAGLEDENDAGQARAVIDGGTAALAGLGLVSRQERLDRLPKFVRNQGARHGCTSNQRRGLPVIVRTDF